MDNLGTHSYSANRFNWSLLTQSLRRFGKDEEGATLVLWAVMFILLFGLVAMSFDVGRVGVTRSELQSYADHVALAAAGELDGQPDSITRATLAAERLITDFQTYGNGGQTLGGAADFSLTFHTDLPPRVTQATDFATTNPLLADYVRVQVVEQEVPLTFARAFAAMTGTSEPNNKANAFAVAGVTSYTCNAVQLWFCLPSGVPSTGDILGNRGLAVGNMVQFVSGGSTGQYGPGNWGFIDQSSMAINPTGPCAGLSGTGPLLRCILGAHGNIGQCIKGRLINVEPGQKKGITGVSINTRFDIYEGSMQSAENDADYSPAPIVTKGIVGGGNGCKYNNGQTSFTTDTIKIPRDDCFATNSCVDNRFGDGDWDFEGYMFTNYDTNGIPGNTTDYPQWYQDDFAGRTNADPPSRWEVYQAEADALVGLPAGRDETGLPKCSSAINAFIGAERRLMLAAAVDCTNRTVAGSARDVPVEGYIEFFLTEPVGKDPSIPGNEINLFGEVTAVYEQGDFQLISTFREVPHLVD